MYRNFEEVRNAARAISGARVAVPMGYDPSSLEALIVASERGLASAVIISPVSKVRKSLDELGRSIPPEIEIVDTEDPVEAAVLAVKMVRSGEATMLMKGLMKTSVFQRALLDKESGLRTGKVLSHVAVVRSPRQERLVAITDGGMNIRPDRESFVQIALNGAEVILKLGADQARVALLAAIEVPNEKMPETVMFADIAKQGIQGILVEGPIAVDGAVDPEAAKIKGADGPVAGRANVLVCPDIACGNIFAKGFMYMTNSEGGGLIMGATSPVVMLSRSDKPITKLNSLALGVIVSGGGGNE